MVQQPTVAPPRVIVLFERSGVMRRAFSALGCDAWSCDLKPAADHSKQHLVCDVREVLAGDPSKWSLVIAHPPCTYLCHSAAWAYTDGPYHQQIKPGTLVGPARRAARLRAIELALAVWQWPVPCMCIENPVGVLSDPDVLGPPSQYVQPYDFGDNASKRTGLWLRRLPNLQPDAYRVEPGLAVRGVKRWANQTGSGQNRLGPRRGRDDNRAETYNGLATAMAEQWTRWL